MEFLIIQVMAVFMLYSMKMKAEKPILLGEALFCAVFLIVCVIDMKHNTYLIMLLGGIAMLIMGLASVLNISWVITSEYRGTEIGELIRKKQIQFYIPMGILAFAFYFGIPYISKKMLLILCGLIFFLIVLNYYWGRKLTRQIRQLEAEQEMSPVLMTDTEREKNSRSYIKAMLILLAGIVVSVGYMLYNPVFPLDEQGYGWQRLSVLNSLM